MRREQFNYQTSAVGARPPEVRAESPGLVHNHIVLDLNTDTADDVWLFHGTSEECAHRILTNGWAPRIPKEAVEELGQKEGLSVDVLLPEYLELGQERHRRGEASCATGWRLAASYARNGSEYLYHAKGGAAMHRAGTTEWVAPAPQAERAAVLLIRIPSTLIPAHTRAHLLPDPEPWQSDLLHAMSRVSEEVVIPGSLLAEHLVAIDWIRSSCTCEGALTIAENVPLVDNRLRCQTCFLFGELVGGG